MIFLTTTAIEVDEELLNRCLVLTVDEGREQTRAIHERQRERRRRSRACSRKDGRRSWRVHRNAQRLLAAASRGEPLRARSWRLLDHATRTRRDHMKYLTLDPRRGAPASAPAPGEAARARRRDRRVHRGDARRHRGGERASRTRSWAERSTSFRRRRGACSSCSMRWCPSARARTARAARRCASRGARCASTRGGGTTQVQLHLRRLGGARVRGRPPRGARRHDGVRARVCE